MGLVSTGRLVVVVVVLWLGVVLLLGGPLFRGATNGLTSNGEIDDQVLARLTRAVGELEILKRQNQELRAMIDSIRAEADSGSSPIATTAPSEKYEMYRRRVDNGVRELWYYARNQLTQRFKDAGNPVERAKAISQGIYQHKQVILSDLEMMRKFDGYDTWRKKESEQLSEIVQGRLRVVQNPKDCKNAKKISCALNKGCGYGCQIHHATYCLITAYATKRTMLLESKNWRYASQGFETVFQPLSNSCRTADNRASSSSWPNQDSEIMSMPIIDAIHPKPNFLPLAVPKDIAPRISRLHGNPALWWISQIIKFLLRPQPHIEEFLNQQVSKLGRPIVGIHVRRTDKVGTEAAFHPLEEYMEYVDEYFDKLELTQDVKTRHVYLATDEPKLLIEAREKYPNYVFYGDSSVAESASLKNRYSTESLKGVVLDIHMLSKTEYIVCTFSSQVCRLAFELMQQRYPDAAERYRSLDDIFYFGGQRDHDQVAIFSHNGTRPDEFDFKKGDIIGIAGNHWDGYSKGVNRRTGKSGLYPSYKAVERVDAVDEFPVFDESDKS